LTFLVGRCIVFLDFEIPAIVAGCIMGGIAMDPGIAIVVCMTSWVALSINVVTGGLPVVTDFLSLLATAGAIMTIWHIAWRLRNGSLSGRPRFRARRIIFSGIIGIQLGKFSIVTFCLFVEPDKFWVILWFMTLVGTVMTVVMRSVFLRHARAQLAKDAVSTT
jgi:hypothetical protein